MNIETRILENIFSKTEKDGGGGDGGEEAEEAGGAEGPADPSQAGAGDNCQLLVMTGG